MMGMAVYLRGVRQTIREIEGIRNNMSDQESNRNRRIVGWGIIGLIAVIGVSIALSLYLAPWRTGGLSYPFSHFILVG